jgi:hypothetical protein
MEKIFEIREYTDGGPSDRGDVTGYIKTGKTRDQMREENGHGFTDYIELTKEEYLKKKRIAEQHLEMFNIKLTQQVRNGSKVKIISSPHGSNNKIGDEGIVKDYYGDSGSEGGFRVSVEGRKQVGNWHSIDEVEILKY